MKKGKVMTFTRLGHLVLVWQALYKQKTQLAVEAAGWTEYTVLWTSRRQPTKSQNTKPPGCPSKINMQPQLHLNELVRACHACSSESALKSRSGCWWKHHIMGVTPTHLSTVFQYLTIIPYHQYRKWHPCQSKCFPFAIRCPAGILTFFMCCCILLVTVHGKRTYQQHKLFGRESVTSSKAKSVMFVSKPLMNICCGRFCTKIDLQIKCR